MQSYCNLTPKTKFMEKISHDHYPNYWKEKKYMKSSQSSNIDDEVEDINTTSNGKVIPSPKQHGKMNQHFLMTETWSTLPCPGHSTRIRAESRRNGRNGRNLVGISCQWKPT